MKVVFACVSILGLAGAAATAVAAQDRPEVAFNLGVVSDYVFRGASQSDEGAAIQGGVDVALAGLYGGAWASSVDFGDGTDAEIDLYGGYSAEAGGFTLDVGMVGYLYVGAPDGTDYGFVEFKAAASRHFGATTLGAAVHYSPDFFGVDEQATYLEANAAVAPAERWTVSGAVGRQWLDVSDDYTAWNLGVGYAMTNTLAVEVRYHGASIDGPLTDDRIVAGLTSTF